MLTPSIPPLQEKDNLDRNMSILATKNMIEIAPFRCHRNIFCKFFFLFPLVILKVNTSLIYFIQHKPLDFRRYIAFMSSKSVIFHFSKNGKHTSRGKILIWPHITLSLWLCDFYVIRNLLRQLFLTF